MAFTVSAPLTNPWVQVPGNSLVIPPPDYGANEFRRTIGSADRVRTFYEDTQVFAEKPGKKLRTEAELLRAFPGATATNPGHPAGGRAAVQKMLVRQHQNNDLSKRPLFSNTALQAHQQSLEENELRNVTNYKEAHPERFASTVNVDELEAKLDYPNAIQKRFLQDAGAARNPLYGFEDSGLGRDNVELLGKTNAAFVQRRDRGFIPAQGSAYKAGEKSQSLKDILNEAADRQSRNMDRIMQTHAASYRPGGGAGTGPRGGGGGAGGSSVGAGSTSRAALRGIRQGRPVGQRRGLPGRRGAPTLGEERKVPFLGPRRSLASLADPYSELEEEHEGGLVNLHAFVAGSLAGPSAAVYRAAPTGAHEHPGVPPTITYRHVRSGFTSEEETATV